MSSHLEQIKRGVDFIESHLDVPFALPEVSKAAGMSHWHFQRMFRAITGGTLMAYVRSRRLTRALVRLLESSDRILDIAYDAGFESQESFTRAFQRAFGIPPGRFRKLGNRRMFPERVQIDEAYLSHVAKGRCDAPVIEERDSVTVVGLRTRFFGPDSEKNNLALRIPDLWDAFLPHLAEIGPRDECYGLVRSQPGGEALTYLACTEGIPESTPSLETDVVPAGTWAVFEHRGPSAALDHTVTYAYATWLAGSREWRHTYGPDLEIYGTQWHATSPASVMHYAIPVKRMNSG